jgi:hypothetical protein
MPKNERPVKVMDYLKRRIFAIAVLACLLAVGTSSRQAVPMVRAIGVANIAVTGVYWGSNPQVPTMAHPGDTNVQLSIILSNVGDDVARSVNATLFLGLPLTYEYYQNGVQYSATAVSKFAGDIGAGQSFTLSFTMSVDSNASEGIYQYNLLVSYKSARELQQIQRNLVIDVPLWKGELHIQSVVTIPTKIYPGSKQVLLKVGIVNSGMGAAKDLQLQLALKPPFTASSSSSDRVYVGNIPAGQGTEADYVVDIADNAQFGQYSVVLGEQTADRMIPVGELSLYVNEKVNFEIVSVTPSTVSVGDSGRVIQVALRNNGTVKADSVRVQLRVGNFFTGTLTDFLGTMLAGETKSAFFTVDIDSKAQPGQYNLDLRLDWTQEDNALDNTQTLNLLVVAPSPPVTLIAIGLIVLVAIGGYLFIRRRRMKAVQTPPK